MGQAPVDLSTHRVAVIVFAMDGCGACDHYVPRLVAKAQELNTHGYSFAIYEPGKPVPRNAVPILLYDAASMEPEIQKLADRFAVQATPTTIVLSRGAGSFKVEGNLADNQITWLLNMANEVN
jgi:thiol-disulfide isomerase/thioredoxin